MDKALARELLLALAGNPGISGNSLRAAFQAGINAWQEHFPEDSVAKGRPLGASATSGALRGHQVEPAPKKPRKGQPTKDDAFRAWQAIRVSKGLPANSREEFEADLASGAHNLAELLAYLEA